MHHDRQCNETVEKAEMQANIAKCFQGSLLFLPLHSYKMWLIKFLMPPMPKQMQHDHDNGNKCRAIGHICSPKLSYCTQLVKHSKHSMASSAHAILFLL